MTSSGIKRGVAATAISALAVAGLPFLAGSASAQPITAQYDAEEVQLLSQFSGAASTKDDGQNTTVRVEAGAGTGVNSMTFEYQIGAGAWQNIATVTSRNDDGAFSTEWNATALNGATVNIRAYETGTVAADTADVRNGVEILGGGAAEESVNITDGSALGAFSEPYTEVTGSNIYASLSGTSSADEDAPVNFVHFFGNDEGAPAGSTTVDADGAFSGLANLMGYDFAGSPDQIVLGATTDDAGDAGAIPPIPATDGTDDTEGFTLYQQSITTVTAVAEDSNVPAGESTEVTVTVTDQNGDPVPGAEVRPSNGDITDDEASDDVEYTDANGEVTFTQSGGTTYYYANANDSNAYEAGLGDKRSGDVTVSEFNAEPTTLEGESVDGMAFDFNEYQAGDITVQVKNQNGGDVASTDQVLSYYWEVTPFDTDVDPYRVPDAPAENAGTPSGDAGEYDVVLPTTDSGTYELFASLGEKPGVGGGDIAESSVLTVKAGQAEVVYDDADPEVAPAGTTEEVAGSLELEDGTGLGGRGLSFTYTGGDDAFIDDANDDATTALETEDNGSFAFDVVDPEVDPQTSERGDLDVTAVNATEDGDNVGAVAPDDQTVVFAASAAPDDSVITLTGDTTVDQPGDVKTVTVDVVDDGAADVSNTQVTLTTDHGYFTNATGTANFGQSITVATDDTGDATAYLTIGRDEGFDDDGDVTSVVTATSGNNTESENYLWSSDYNADEETEGDYADGEIDVVFSDSQTVGVLPKAPFETEDVNFDVFAYDAFGNPIDGVTVDLDGDDVIDTNDTTNATAVTDLDNDVDFTVSQTAAGDEDYTATWNVNDPTVAAPANTVDLEDTETVEWYAIEITTATLTATGSNPHPVGSTVTMTYKAVDQNGEPVHGYAVEFYRSGPDNTNDGESQADRTTNGQGEAYYVFQGEVAGDAIITTVVYDTAGNIVPDGQATETVTFGQGTDGKTKFQAKLKGKNNGALPNDKLKAFAPKVAAGATVSLFKIKKNGKKFILATKTANDKGNAFFRVKDRNGAKKTTYRAKYRPTPTTKRDWTNKRTVR